MTHLSNKELLKALESISWGLFNGCGTHDLSDYFNKSQIASIYKLGKLIRKIQELEYPSTIMGAVRKGDFTILEELLQTKGGEINAQDEWGYTALRLAVELHESPGMVAMLLDAGADPSIKCYDELTPLEYAQDYELFEVGELFKEYGVVDGLTTPSSEVIAVVT